MQQTVKMNWFDLVTVRDEINRQCYEQGAKEAFWVSLLGAAGFVAILLAAQAVSYTLLIQFVVGAVSLHILARVLRKFAPRPKQAFSEFRRTMGEAAGSEMSDWEASRWGLVIGFFEIKTSSRQELPIQQNALLALSLIGFQSNFFYDLRATWQLILLYSALGVLFLLIRMLEEFQTQSRAWRMAAQALSYSVKQPL